MVNTRPRQDPQHLLDLKAGLDRGGVARTWDEVGYVQGISGAHAQRCALKVPRRDPPVVRIDPRTIIPELASILTSDEDAWAWNDEHLCLCGCGQVTLQEEGRTGKVPCGAFRLFRGAHFKRMPWVRYQQLVLTPEQNRKRIRAIALTQDTILAAGIAGIIQEWRVKPRNSLRELARRSGLSEHHIKVIAAGRRLRIQKLTAARLLTAMNEPLRPELASVYHIWLANTQGSAVKIS